MKRGMVDKQREFMHGCQDRQFPAQDILSLQEKYKYEINVSWQTLFIVNCFVKEKESK